MDDQESSRRAYHMVQGQGNALPHLEVVNFADQSYRSRFRFECVYEISESTADSSNGGGWN